MALRFVDSFDTYNATNMYSKWTSSSGLVIGASGRRGTSAAQLTSGNLMTKTLDNQVTWIVGVAYKFNTFATAGDIITLLDGATIQAALRLNADFTLSVTRGGAGAGVVLGTTTFLLVQDVYYYIELKVTIDNTTGSAEVRIDELSKLSLSNVDTQNSANAYASTVKLGVVGAANHYFDDLYICDGSGTANNNFLGTCQVDALLPNAEGTNLQWTPSTGTLHYAVVDESPPNTTDYVSDAVAANRDSWNYPALPAITNPSVIGVQLILVAQKDDTGARSIKPLCKSGATTNVLAAQALNTAWTAHLGIWETNPNTATAWTIATVEAAEFGVEDV